MGCGEYAYRAHHLPVITDPSKMITHKVGEWSVIPFGVRHDSEGTLGFCVRLGSDQIVYLTDTQFSDYVFPGTTIWALEANWGEDELRANSRSGQIHGARVNRVATNHMSIERVERLLRANDLTKCQEVHLLHLSDENSNAADFKRRIQKITGTPVYIAAKFAQQEVPY